MDEISSGLNIDTRHLGNESMGMKGNTQKLKVFRSTSDPVVRDEGRYDNIIDIHTYT